MSTQRQICPSLLSADFSRLASEIETIERAGAEILHLDIMDGHFVPNLTFGPFIVQAIRKLSGKILEAHLMMTNPGDYLKQFRDAGADTILIHAEACPNIRQDLETIRSLGAKAGLVINPGTSADVIGDLLPYLDQVLFMSVNPGFGGQKFMPQVLEKIKTWEDALHRNGVIIEIDGGVNLQTIPEISQTGVDHFVAGSAIFKAENPSQAFQALQSYLH